MRDDLHVTLMDTTKCWYRNNCPDYESDKCNYMCPQMQQTKYCLDLSNLPYTFRKPQNLNINILPENIRTYIEYVLDNIEYYVSSGYGAVFYGNVGCGKTSWAVKMMTTYFCRIAKRNNFICRGLFIPVASFLRDVKLNIAYKDKDFLELINTIKECDIVIWDDIIQTIPTEYESQWLYSLINERIMNGKTNICTTNLTPKEFERVDKRLYSRLISANDVFEFSNIGDIRKFHTFQAEINAVEGVQDNTDTTDNNTIDNSIAPSDIVLDNDITKSNNKSWF